MIKQSLHDNWAVRAVGDLSEVPSSLRDIIVPSRVPGCVHTDLMRAGKIPDPYRDLNEFAVRWIGLTDWEYRTIFDADAKLFDHERIDLVCDGLDTFARIELNGSLVAETFNMHRGYRFDVRPHLKKGKNELTITFASPVKSAKSMRDKLGPRPYCNGPGGPFNFIRKMACNLGWDWGPALPTCGIWRGVRLEGWTHSRIEALRVDYLTAIGGTVSLTVDVSIQSSGGDAWGLTASLLDPTGNPVGSAQFDEDDTATKRSVTFAIDKPIEWWPVGHGAQPLYALTLQSGKQIVERRIGLRTIELDTSPDDIGRKFVVKVNGKPIFCKGFNWIPDDCFLDRACEPDRVRQRIGQAVDAGANMLRVWGGGIFETDEFYNICDEMGVLVWQDFLFACAMYPEEEPFWSEIEAEARYNVARLAHHPSLAIWNGCNENIWAYRDWGWKDHEDQKGRTWGKNYYFDLLPRICKELTPATPYWAGSPWSGDYDVDNGVPPNAATHGNKHVWEAWFKQDYAVYRTMEPRFCSEFGFQGPATYSSIANVVPPEARDFGSLEMRHRQKAGDCVRDDGDRRNLRHLLAHFNLPGAAELLAAFDPLDPKGKVPYCGCQPLLPAKSLPSSVNFDDLHYLLQVNQARALALGVEWFRSRQPTCMGTLYWQLNDCWPGGTTWSCIDGDGRYKPLWYATRRFFRNVLWTFQPEKDGSVSLCIINDSDEELHAHIPIARMDFSGKVLAEQETGRTIAPRSVERITAKPEVGTPGDPTREMLWAGHKQHSATWYFAPDKELRYPAPDFIADWTDGRLTIRAGTLLRDVCVFVDRLDPEATVSDQLVTIFPRESFTFYIRSDRKLTQKELTTSPVLRCVNSFGTM